MKKVKFETGKDINDDSPYVKILYKGQVIGMLVQDFDDVTGGWRGEEIKDKINLKLCGFRHAHTMWGCGSFSTNEGQATKDMQFIFDEDSKKMTNEEMSGITERCLVCFHDEHQLLTPIFGTNMKCIECKCNDLMVYPNYPFNENFRDNVEWSIYQKLQRMSNKNKTYWVNALNVIFEKYGIKDEIDNVVKSMQMIKDDHDD